MEVRKIDKNVRVNERIRVPQVRLIAEDGEPVGIVATPEALAIARERGLDLVEVAPTSRPPVCKLMDYGRYRYEESKKARVAKKKQHVTQLKEVKLRPKIEAHDWEVKVRNARRFLGARDKVKFTVMFRGREQSHPELGERLLRRVAEELQEIATVELPPKREGRTMTMVMIPKKGAEAPAKGKGSDRKKSEAEPARASADGGAPDA
jgi:translation initiation factor IF-3